MKVLYVTQATHQTSGIGRYSFEVINEAKKQGITASVLTENELPLKKNVFRLIKNCFVVFMACRDCDSIHALDGWPYGVYAYMTAVVRRKPFFISGVGTYSVAPLNHFGKGWLLTLAYRNAAKIFCISSFTEQRIRKYVPSARAQVVPVGAPELPSASNVFVDRVREKYQISGHTPIVLTVGAVKHRKGQLTTLKALVQLKDIYPDFLYVAVGANSDSGYVQSVEAYAHKMHMYDNVRLITSGVSDEELSALYRMADIFVLNSNNDGEHFEGFGLVILEAAGFGVPAVGSRGCGIEDAIHDGVSGLLARQGDEEDIAQKIERVLKERDRFSKGALSFYKRFTWKRTVQEYVHWYQITGQ